MKKQSKQRNQGSKGITLIALVITISTKLLQSSNGPSE